MLDSQIHSKSSLVFMITSQKLTFQKNHIKTVILSGSKTEFSYPKFTNSSNVQYLDSVGCNVNNFQIQDILIGLHLRYCHFGAPEELNFRMQSSLQHSYLINCPLPNVNISFPQSLEEAFIKKCGFVKFPCFTEI